MVTRWNPTNEWKDQDVFVVGGGASLRHFSLPLLRGHRTIGCNDAFRLGPGICSVCLFGDRGWFERAKWDLEKFSGIVATMAVDMPICLPWLRIFERQHCEWGEEHNLGWWYSTGTSAVNLAVNLGAKRIFLLGFDMGLRGYQSHWHDSYAHVTKESAFQRHLKGFTLLAKEVGKRSQVPVYNVSDSLGSRLAIFPTLSFSELERIALI